MGEGTIDQSVFFARFRLLCPNVPVHIETISGFSRELPYLQPDFWKAWPQMPARSLARFEALARAGHAVAPWQAPAGQDKTKAEQDYQRGELERSICTAETGCSSVAERSSADVRYLTWAGEPIGSGRPRRPRPTSIAAVRPDSLFSQSASSTPE